jgi:hypothetical protein
VEPPGRPSDAADLHQEPLRGAQRAAIAAVADLRVQGLAVGEAVVVAGLQVALERAELAGAAAGVRADELLGCWCAAYLRAAPRLMPRRRMIVVMSDPRRAGPARRRGGCGCGGAASRRRWRWGTRRWV